MEIPVPSFLIPISYKAVKIEQYQAIFASPFTKKSEKEKRRDCYENESNRINACCTLITDQLCGLR
jgi:hypothetical protein